MKLRAFINFKESLNTSVGVNMHINLDGTVVYRFVVLKNIKGLVEICSRRSEISETALMKEIAEYLDAGVRVNLNITGKGVLIKKILDDGDLESALSANFPFLRSDEILAQLYDNTNGRFLSVLKTENFIIPLGLIESNCLCSISVGPLVVDNIAVLLKQEIVTLSGYTLTLRQNAIENISTAQATDNNQIELGDEKLQTDELLAYASALAAFLPSPGILIGNTGHVAERGMEAYKFRSRLYKLTRVGLASVLIVLLVNSFAFYILQSRNNDIDEALRVTTIDNTNTTSWSARQQSLSKAYRSLGWESNLIPVYYADQIAATVPKGILLTKLEIGQKDNVALRKDRSIRFTNAEILVQGISTSQSDLDAWVTTISEFTWTQKITDRVYEYVPREKSGTFGFKILMK